MVLLEVYKGYCREFQYKKEACSKLMNCCFYEKNDEDAIQQLNNIVNIWTTDVHIQGKDSRLIRLYKEIEGLED